MVTPASFAEELLRSAGVFSRCLSSVQVEVDGVGTLLDLSGECRLAVVFRGDQVPGSPTGFAGRSRGSGLLLGPGDLDRVDSRHQAFVDRDGVVTVFDHRPGVGGDARARKELNTTLVNA